MGWDASYLWGPPGTGKTTTLGYLVAEYLQARKASRILLVSSTNVASDTALLSVDERVKSLFPSINSAVNSSVIRPSHPTPQFFPSFVNRS
ncbi:MAG: AAA family ATPase [Acidobacteriota bacterium]|nr:AAA family ATPase [Acidobacteriota bacterium]